MSKPKNTVLEGKLNDHNIARGELAMAMSAVRETRMILIKELLDHEPMMAEECISLNLAKLDRLVRNRIE